MSPANNRHDKSDHDPDRKPALTSAERKREEARAKYRRKHRLLRIGQALMAVGALVGLVHLVAHLGFFGGQPSGAIDLIAGYPMAGLLFVTGAVLAGR